MANCESGIELFCLHSNLKSQHLIPFPFFCYDRIDTRAIALIRSLA
ncbi:MAG: hypothetical protein F6K14_32480 [Symploca sp. SIO2C1]|nr:hypothetical protein [Symploca sp. SIO2C1]